MKTLILSLLIFTAPQDSTRLKEIAKQFMEIQKIYIATDSLQIKRKGVMEFLQMLYAQEEQKLKQQKEKKKNE